MATRNEAIVSSEVDGVTLLNTSPQSSESSASDYRAWLDQALKVREKAFRLAGERISSDGGAPPTIAACDYLTESEKLFELTRTLLISAHQPPSA